jgi:4-hydroxy-tetrahydrodipicolinate reductase
VPIIAMGEDPLDGLIERRPIDALVDFSSAHSATRYLRAVRRHRLMLVSAISNYTPEQLASIQALADHCRVMCSPNITVGINFLIVAARLLRTIAPQADIEVIEQHFRDKPEVSGTARRIAHTLDLDEARITSLRLGGIVGHHEVVFGFPHQTVRLTHDSIRREAFGTGAAFALRELQHREAGLYTMEDLIAGVMRGQLQVTM